MLPITLTDTETSILHRYRNHLYQTARISEPVRTTLNRVLIELNTELNMIQQDLEAESKFRTTLNRVLIEQSPNHEH